MHRKFLSLLLFLTTFILNTMAAEQALPPVSEANAPKPQPVPSVSDPVEDALASPAPQNSSSMAAPEDVVNAEKLLSRGEPLSAQLAYQTAWEKLLALPMPHNSDVSAHSEQSAELPQKDNVLAEYILYRLLTLSAATGENGELIKLFNRAVAEDASSRVPPFLRMLCTRALGEIALRQGDKKTAENSVAAVGMLRDYAVVGPFANERGHAFPTDLLRRENSAENEESGTLDFTRTFRGKKSRIGWRLCPTIDPLGALNFAALCQPAEEALAYAAVLIECEHATEAALRLGSDDALAVWVNGQVILREDVERSAIFAQSSIGCRLQKGINVILFKVGQARGHWELLAALTQPDGKRLTGVKEVTKKFFGGKVDCKPAEATAPPEVAGGAVPFLAAYLKQHSRDARAHYYYACLLASRGTLGRHSQLPRQQMMLAMRCAPKDPAIPLALAELADESTRFKADRDENVKRLALLKALEIDPGNVAALTALGNYYLHSMNSPLRAREYVDMALAQNRFAAGANVLLGEIFSGRTWHTRALSLLSAISQRHPRNRQVRRAQAESLLQNGQAPAALAAYRELIAICRTDGDAVLAAAGLLQNAGRYREAMNLWRDYLELCPYDLISRRELAKTWLAALISASATPKISEPASAVAKNSLTPMTANNGFSPAALLSFLDTTLEIAPDHPEFSALRGRALLAAGRPTEAATSFTAALAADPGQTTVRDYLRYRGQELPELLPPIPDLAEFIANFPPENAVAGAGRVIYLSEQIDELSGDGAKRRGLRVIYRILSQTGAEISRRFPVWYDPDIESVTFTNARVLHGDGNTNEAQIVPVRRPGERQVLMAVFPALAKGDIIEISYVVSQSRPDFFGDYFGHIQRFRKSERTLISRYVLRAPAGKELFFHRTGEVPEAQKETLADGTRQWTWELRDLPPLPEEPFAPPPSELTPAVQISTFQDWNALARWYWGLVKSQNIATSEISEKVTELTSGCSTPRERAAAIYEWVTTEVRNNAWSFGVHGFKPYNAGTIFTRRFGDCKDKTTLINVMARAAGLTAWPVLIRATDYDIGRGKEDLTLPVLAHFNHCISLLEIDGKPLFLDGTMSYHTIDGLPFTIRGAEAVVVRPEGAIRVSTPPYSPNDNLWQENAIMTLENDGSADLAFTVRGRGQTSVYLRAWFRNDQTWDQVLRAAGADKYGHISAAVVNEVLLDPEIEELAPDETKLDARLRLRGYVKSGGTEMICRLPAPFLSGIFGRDGAIPAQMGSFAVSSHRETGVALPALFTIERTLRVEFPENWELLNVMPLQTLTHPFGTLRAEFAAHGNYVEIKYSLSLHQTRIAPADYPAFRRFCLVADQLMAMDLHFRRANNGQ